MHYAWISLTLNININIAVKIGHPNKFINAVLEFSNTTECT